MTGLADARYCKKIICLTNTNSQQKLNNKIEKSVDKVKKYL